MDIWEANNDAAAFTPHPCSVDGQTRCSGNDCGAGDARYEGLCDADGCDFNSFRMGDQSFLGMGKTVDTSKKFTVVTQFISSDNTTSGSLAAIRRIYVQDGVVIQNSMTNVAGIDPTNEITDEFCTQQKTVFGDQDYFATKGGLKGMGQSLANGMVLALSVWDDYAAYMEWLDSDYPTDKDATAPGVARGTCSSTSGLPATVESVSSSASVTFSNIKFGDIGSTFTGTGGAAPPPGSTVSTGPTGTAPPPSQTSTVGTVAQYGQCGGTGFTGATACVAPFTCHVVNPCESFSFRQTLIRTDYPSQTTPSACRRSFIQGILSCLEGFRSACTFRSL